MSSARSQEQASPRRALRCSNGLDDLYLRGAEIWADVGPVEIMGLDGIRSRGTVSCGSSSVDGLFELRSAASGFPVLSIEDGVNGAEIIFRSDFSLYQGGIWSDPDAGGGLSMALGRSDTAVGLSVQGNHAGLEATRMDLFDGQFLPVVTLSSNSVGDDTVRLRDDSLSAEERLDEPGVASQALNLSTVPGFGVTTLASRSLTVPADGYVLVMATSQITVSHGNETADWMSFGVSDQFDQLPINQDVGLRIPDTAPSANMTQPITVHGLFSVSAGFHTFYLLVDRFSGGSVLSFDTRLTLTYLPSAYGVVSSTNLASEASSGFGEGAAMAEEFAPQRRAVDDWEIGVEQREEEERSLEALLRRQEALEARYQKQMAILRSIRESPTPER